MLQMSSVSDDSIMNRRYSVKVKWYPTWLSQYPPIKNKAANSYPPTQMIWEGIFLKCLWSTSRGAGKRCIKIKHADYSPIPMFQSSLLLILKPRQSTNMCLQENSKVHWLGTVGFIGQYILWNDQNVEKIFQTCVGHVWGFHASHIKSDTDHGTLS